MHTSRHIILLLLASLLYSSNGLARENAIDTSDPSRIYSGVGFAAGTSEYENGESRQELRGSLSWALTPDDMLQVESGYGHHNSNSTGGDESGLTHSRLYYRHRLPFNDSLEQGFRGMSFQMGLHLSGELAGTDGQTVISGGATPSVKISESLDFYPVVDLLGSFDKNFKNFNGIGFDIAPLLSYNPDYLWPGAALQIEPNFTQYVIGQFAFGNSRNLKVACAGTLFETLNWTLAAEKHAGRDLMTYRGENSADLKHDWSASFELLATF